MLLWFTLRKIRKQRRVLSMNTSICMHGCIFLSGRGCITDVAKVSTLELLTTALSDPVHLQAPVIAGNIKTCAL